SQIRLRGPPAHAARGAPAGRHFRRIAFSHGAASSAAVRVAGAAYRDDVAWAARHRGSAGRARLLAQVRPGIDLRFTALAHSFGPLAGDGQTRPRARSLPPAPAAIGVLSRLPGPYLTGERRRQGDTPGAPGRHSPEDRGKGG